MGCEDKGLMYRKEMSMYRQVFFMWLIIKYQILCIVYNLELFKLQTIQKLLISFIVILFEIGDSFNINFSAV